MRISHRLLHSFPGPSLLPVDVLYFFVDVFGHPLHGLSCGLFAAAFLGHETSDLIWKQLVQLSNWSVWDVGSSWARLTLFSADCKRFSLWRGGGRLRKPHWILKENYATWRQAALDRPRRDLKLLLRSFSGQNKVTKGQILRKWRFFPNRAIISKSVTSKLTWVQLSLFGLARSQVLIRLNSWLTMALLDLIQINSWLKIDFWNLI